MSQDTEFSFDSLKQIHDQIISDNTSYSSEIADCISTIKLDHELYPRIQEVLMKISEIRGEGADDGWLKSRLRTIMPKQVEKFDRKVTQQKVKDLDLKTLAEDFKTRILEQNEGLREIADTLYGLHEGVSKAIPNIQKVVEGLEEANANGTNHGFSMREQIEVREMLTDAHNRLSHMTKVKGQCEEQIHAIADLIQEGKQNYHTVDTQMIDEFAMMAALGKMSEAAEMNKTIREFGVEVSKSNLELGFTVRKNLSQQRLEGKSTQHLVDSEKRREHLQRELDAIENQIDDATIKQLNTARDISARITNRNQMLESKSGTSDMDPLARAMKHRVGNAPKRP